MQGTTLDEKSLEARVKKLAKMPDQFCRIRTNSVYKEQKSVKEAQPFEFSPRTFLKYTF